MVDIIYVREDGGNIKNREAGFDKNVGIHKQTI